MANSCDIPGSSSNRARLRLEESRRFRVPNHPTHSRLTRTQTVGGRSFFSVDLPSHRYHRTLFLRLSGGNLSGLNGSHRLVTVRSIVAPWLRTVPIAAAVIRTRSGLPSRPGCLRHCTCCVALLVTGSSLTMSSASVFLRSLRLHSTGTGRTLSPGRRRRGGSLRPSRPPATRRSRWVRRHRIQSARALPFVERGWGSSAANYRGSQPTGRITAMVRSVAGFAALLLWRRLSPSRPGGRRSMSRGCRMRALTGCRTVAGRHKRWCFWLRGTGVSRRGARELPSGGHESRKRKGVSYEFGYR